MWAQTHNPKVKKTQSHTHQLSQPGTSVNSFPDHHFMHYLCFLLFRLLGSSNVGDTLPTGQLSNIPWRRAGVKYTNNEAYFDVVEEIDAIIDKSGNCVHVVLFGKNS